MSHNTKKSGFTLLELILSIGILSAISVVLVGFLYTILIVRSKQQSIETSASASRLVFTTITNAIESASVLPIPTPSPPTLPIKGSPCRTIQLNAGRLQQQTDSAPNCIPPAITPSSPYLSPPGVTVTNFNLVSSGGLIYVGLIGTYTDQFGAHTFNYLTSVTPRLSL